ncbi:MAG: hypothetical protein HC904_14485 [Blastochloris sp.]|nr:hypothetical protein [Blastochloris sp.]
MNTKLEPCHPGKVLVKSDHGTRGIIMNEAEEHLKYLRIGYYVFGGITAVFALFPLLHVAVGIAAITGLLDNHSSQGSFPPMVGWLFVVMGSVFILMGQCIAAFSIFCGRCIKKRQHYLCILITGCILCALFPFGTVIGVFTIILLNKPEIKKLFEKKSIEPGVEI